MKLLITFASDDNVLNIEVSDDMSLGDLKAYIEIESSVSSSSQVLVYKSQPMEDDALPLNNWNLEDDDVIIVIQRPENLPSVTNEAAPGPSPTTTVPGAAQLEQLRNQIINDPFLRNNIEQRYPQLRDAIDNPDRFRELMGTIENERQQEQVASNDEMRRLQQDPDNEENQRRILELIQQQAVMENLQNAIEHNPEVFGNITMLFVDVLVNGHRVKAFVDSGAQATVISPECVDRCELSHLIDKRFQGVAHGVGTAKILGRIHSAPIKVGDSFYPCSFTVMEGKSVDLLLGLDMLKRYQANIDLRRNVLVFGDSECPFLGESEIPKIFGEGQGEEEDSSEGITPSTSVSSNVGSVSEGGSARASSAASAGASAGTSAGTSATPAAPSFPQPSSFSDNDIQNLMGLGFSRAEVINALRQTGGNAELAAALLFQ